MGVLLIFVAIFICLDALAILLGLDGMHRWLVGRDLKEHREVVAEERQRPQSRISEWQRRLSEMGDPTGKTLREIIETVGLPNSYSNVGRNLLVRWSQLGINVSFLFEYKPETSAPVNISQHEVDFVCLRIIQQSNIGKIA